ncbi:MAG: triose-phosphate isomerase [Bacteroidetes bacterium]|nr:MAG: triose-phosphate isomerase [Bacteroidota bacterium]MBL1144758.1 triose-phosphate isomerase [Bacteroidota bacterium]MCB0802990.1 triose-phosphate isomerase [Flavobacteriales bacterium]NOG57552.1 triose-phosphate isomerase [Bacteroidota bacterium]
MRKNRVAGNWKMNKSLQEGEELTKNIIALNDNSNDVELIIIPPFVQLSSLVKLTQNTDIKIGSQNNHEAKSGAYTGEISASMLSALGVSYGLVGHSERRTYFNETNEQLLAKTKALLSEGIIPIFCCGEHLNERNSNQHFVTVENQLNALKELTAEDFAKLIIAYEPVWAIGTGETASAEQAQEMHAFIRKYISSNFGKSIADNCSVLYGGSCKPSNAKELFAMPDVDGGLIGGASLVAEDFIGIKNSF